MKRSLLYLLILAAVLVCPTKATDVGELQPVQTIAVYKGEDGYAIATDTKDTGRGASIPAAIENLKETTPATIYLDTAQYLLVSDDSLVDHLRPYLKQNVKIYGFIGDPPMDTVSKYLAAHEKGPTVRRWQMGDDLPVLDCRRERLNFL